MGLSYSSIILQTDDTDTVLSAAKSNATVPVWVSPPSKGFICIFSRAIEDYDLAAALSTQLKCSALAAVASQEEVFRYALYVKGKRVDWHDSCPDYPAGEQQAIRGNAKLLSSAFGCESKAAKIKKVISEDFLFPSSQFTKLLKNLGMSTWMAGSYDYLSEFELEHKNIYKLGSHFDPINRKSASAKNDEMLVIVEQAGYNNELKVPVYKDLSKEPTDLQLPVGKKFSKWIYLVNRGTHCHGLDIRISGSAIDKELVRPAINTSTGSSAIQPTSRLDKTADGSWICSMPKKEVRAHVSLEFKLTGLKAGAGDVKVEARKHSPSRSKKVIWSLNLSVGKQSSKK